jgi:hypothetical protein
MKKPRIKKNRYDNWYGYLGSQRVKEFGESSTQTQEQAANEWLEIQSLKYQNQKDGLNNDKNTETYTNSKQT